MSIVALAVGAQDSAPVWSPMSSGAFPVALNATAGYLVGRLLGFPVAGAVATGAFGMVGLLGVVIYSVYEGKK